MNKQDLKFYSNQKLARLKNSLSRVIAKFPKHWNDNHVDVAIGKLVENPELTTEEVIKAIKRSWVCAHENNRVDGGDEYIPKTEEEENFNAGVI